MKHKLPTVLHRPDENLLKLPLVAADDARDATNDGDLEQCRADELDEGGKKPYRRRVPNPAPWIPAHSPSGDVLVTVQLPGLVVPVVIERDSAPLSSRTPSRPPHHRVDWVFKFNDSTTAKYAPIQKQVPPANPLQPIAFTTCWELDCIRAYCPFTIQHIEPRQNHTATCHEMFPRSDLPFHNVGLLGAMVILSSWTIFG